MFEWFTDKGRSKAECTPKVVKYQFNSPQPIAEFFKANTGIHFEDQMTILNSKLTSFCTLRQIQSFESCLVQLKNDEDLKQALFNYLTTNETYFYREIEQIKTLVSQVKNETGPVDILCIPCSTGEEPYSIAIALLEAGVTSRDFRLVGVDINTEAIRRAKAGVYNERNVSRIPNHLVGKYFITSNDKHVIRDNIKSLVKFRACNLFDREFTQFGKFDFVLSRNMFIYFDLETRKTASSILESLLKDSRHKIIYGHADLY